MILHFLSFFRICGNEGTSYHTWHNVQFMQSIHVPQLLIVCVQFNQSSTWSPDMWHEYSEWEAGVHCCRLVQRCFFLIPILLPFTLVQPEIESPPVDKIVLEGNNATFTCKANGIPSPTVSWKFNDGALPARHVARADRLTVFAVQNGRDYEGNYTCVASNRAGVVIAAAGLSVDCECCYEPFSIHFSCCVGPLSQGGGVCDDFPLHCERKQLTTLQVMRYPLTLIMEHLSWCRRATSWTVSAVISRSFLFFRGPLSQGGVLQWFPISY